MGVRAVWLADAARLTGYPVLEVAGWRGRGHGDFRVLEGVVAHHTADGPTGVYPSLGVVRDGRAGLAGPLANLGLGRDGTVLVIADGVGWHAGASTWAGFRDVNDEFLGVEAESVGTRDDWTAAQRDCYPRLVAACLFYLRRDANRCAGHKEIALPLGRKVDPAFTDMNAFRQQVAWMLADPLARINRTGDWFDMATEADLRRIVHEEVFAKLVPDYYTADTKDRMWLSECLAWGTTHAAHARDAARAALAKVTAVESKVDALARVVSGGSATPTEVAQALVDAGIGREVAQALVELLERPAAS
jgi:hypothetical protein